MGKFKPTFSNQELLNYISRHPGCTTADLVAKFSVTRQDIHHRTKKLVGKGFLLVEVGHGRVPSRYTATKNQVWRFGGNAAR